MISTSNQPAQRLKSSSTLLRLLRLLRVLRVLRLLRLTGIYINRGESECTEASWGYGC